MQTDRDIEQLSATLQRIEEKLENLQEMVDKEEEEGTNYRMRHIKTLSSDKTYKMVGMPGLKLRVRNM